MTQSASDKGADSPAIDAAKSAPVAPAFAPLPWVNPARCLPVCAFDPDRLPASSPASLPAAGLRHLDDRGAPSARGKHRVDQSAAPALGALLAAARAAGHAIRVNSAYRSYRDQARVFRTMKESGRAARPGHSEHQLGTAIDLKLPTSAAIVWLAEHAAEHGFALSYPPGKQRVTGYRPEPWHIRFVGVEVAAELQRRGSTLEELFRARPDLGESGTCQDCPAAISRRACGAVTPTGSCKGSVLTWCYDGALAAVDCAASQQTCTTKGETPDCETPPETTATPDR